MGSGTAAAKQTRGRRGGEQAAEVALLELEGQLVDDLYADGEGVGALNADGDGIVIAVAEAGAESALGGDGAAVPEQGDIGDGGYEQQQSEQPSCREQRGVSIAEAGDEGDGKQQEVEAAAQVHFSLIVALVTQHTEHFTWGPPLYRADGGLPSGAYSPPSRPQR